MPNRVVSGMLRQAVPLLCALFVALTVGLLVAAPQARAASCDVVDAAAGYISSERYTYHGYAAGCTQGVTYDWSLTVETKHGDFVRRHTGTRYSAPSGWSTSDYTYSGTGAYCVTFRVRNAATGHIMGSGVDCT
jgi:hypothetical protein